MRTHRRADVIDELSCTADGRLETDAIIGTGYIVIHCLRNSPHRISLGTESSTIAQCIVTANHNEAIQFKEFKIGEYFSGEINPLIRLTTFGICLEVWRQVTHMGISRIGT